MRGQKTIYDIVRVLTLFLITLIALVIFSHLSETNITGKIKVIDGDSVRLKGREIRLFGIDAPEYKQECTKQSGESYPCGRQSRSMLQQMVNNRSVRCVGSTVDKYDRLLAVCRSGERDLNAEMVLKGWAVSYGSYASEENLAQDAGRGIWAGEFQEPAQWRKDLRHAHKEGFLSSVFSW